MSSDRGRRPPIGPCPKRSPKILWREVDGCAVLFHEDTGRAFALNETASRIWKMCDGSTSVGDMSSRLGGPREAAEELVGKLAEDGCVEMAEPSKAGSQPPDEPARSPETWSVPSVEEIVFAACDCTVGGKGVMKKAECVDVPRKTVSVIS